MTKTLIHDSVTDDRVMDAIERSHTALDNPGFCLACGAEAEGCEPDAEEHECLHCGQSKVFGAEQILLCGFYHRTQPRTKASAR